jgi:hypothetical protein
VAADDGEAFAGSESLFETVELRDDVEAIDAAVSEKVDENEGAREMVFPGQRLGDVKPVES